MKVKERNLNIKTLFLGLLTLLILFYFLKTLFISREEYEGGEKERNINVWLPLECPLLEIWPATQTCALTGNQTGDPLVHSQCSIH